jgi:monoamine oxidase
VETIQWRPSGVTVRAGESTVEARQCIVAMSPVNAHGIQFEPGLPWDRDNFHRHAQAGAGVMTVLVYETPFWREQGLSGEAATDFPGGTHMNDNSPEDGSVGVLNSFVSPLPPGMPWGTPRGVLDTPELRRQAVVAVAVAAFGERAGDPLNYVEKDWMNERYIAGVQHGMPPGLITETGPSLLKSAGPLHWCSAEHGTSWPMVMNGAVESGERVAAEVKGML